MNRRTLCLGAAATALTLPLAGCVTVHGERADIPSVRRAEAARVLTHFAEVNNAATKAYDPGLITRIESGPLGAIDEAGVRAKHANHPDGNAAFKPLAFSDSRFLIPRQQGWPKFFVADTGTNRSGDARWLLVFRRFSASEPWKADFLAVATRAELPAFATDKDGSAVELPVADTGLLTRPDRLGATYASYLEKGTAATRIFANGAATSQLRATRQSHSHTADSVTQYADQSAGGRDFTPVALRTADGGALVFFATHHQTRATYRAGYRLSIDPDTKALMTGTPRTSVTLSHTAQEAVTVPAARAKGTGAAGRIVFVSRLVGLVSAKGD